MLRFIFILDLGHLTMAASPPRLIQLVNKLKRGKPQTLSDGIEIAVSIPQTLSDGVENFIFNNQRFCTKCAHR
jgi:hypothetical protein